MLTLKRVVLLAIFLTLGHGAEVNYGLVRSDDQGQNWRPVSDFFRTNRINALASFADQLWAATDHGVYHSRDDGITWNSALPTHIASTRALDLTTHNQTLIIATQRDGIWQSSPDAKTWTQRSALPYVRTVLSTGSALYAGLDTGSVHRIQDDGATWTSISQGLPKEGAQIFQLIFDGASQLYAALYSRGLFAYDQRQNSWSRLGNDAVPRPLAAVSAGAGILIAGHNPGGLHRSQDAGKNWRPVTDNLPSHAPTWTLQRVGQTLYYGTSGESGLYSSADRGQTWSPVAPIQFGHLAVIAITQHHESLFAATSIGSSR